MKLYWIIFLFFFNNINGFYINKYLTRPNLLINNMSFYTKEKLIINEISNNIKKKTTGILQLIRCKNILPTLLLSFSGGWIMNPSLYNLLHSPTFIIATINTLIIMSVSMVINDLFDMELDKINNPGRPLIRGEVTKKEAIIFSTLSLFLCEFLSIKYLPPHLQWVIHLSIIDILAYTKILKPITFVKNVSCSILVSFALCFAGISVNSIYSESNLHLLRIASRLIFFGSLHNELLLDIYDIDGDKEKNIQTIPVIYGKEVTWTIVNLFTNANIIWNTLYLMRIYNYKYGIILLFTTNGLINNLMLIKKYGFSKQLSKHAVNESVKPLFLSLIYLCWLARFL